MNSYHTNLRNKIFLSTLPFPQSSKCPSAEIDIGRRVVYDKKRGMIPGYGGHVPGIHTCTQGSNFGNLTRRVLKQTVSSERLKKGLGC